MPIIKDHKTDGLPLCDNAKLKARNVNVFYGEKQAIFDVSLDIGSNEVIALIGPSGCGKSTFLRCLNRMNDTIDICHVKGEILLDGDNIYDPKVDVVPLRARVGDAALLAHAFTRRFAQEQNQRSLSLAPDAVRAVEQHGWPGNIRELENCLKRAVIMANGSQISADDLGLPVSAAQAEEPVLDLRTVRDEAEKKAVIAALARSNGNVLKAAEMLGISRPTLYDVMHRLGLK